MYQHANDQRDKPHSLATKEVETDQRQTVLSGVCNRLVSCLEVYEKLLTGIDRKLDAISLSDKNPNKPDEGKNIQKDFVSAIDYSVNRFIDYNNRLQRVLNNLDELI